MDGNRKTLGNKIWLLSSQCFMGKMAIGKCWSPFSYNLLSVPGTNLDPCSILDEPLGPKPRLRLGHLKGAVGNLVPTAQINISSDWVTHCSAQISWLSCLLDSPTPE